MQTLTPSEITDHRVCAKKDYLKNRVGLRRQRMSAPLRRGIAGHNAFAAIIQGTPPDEVLEQVCEFYNDDPLEGEIIGRLILGYLWYYQDDQFEPVEMKSRHAKLINPDTGHSSTTHNMTLTAKYSYNRNGLSYFLKHRFSSSGRDFGAGSPEFFNLKMDSEIGYNLLIAQQLGIDVIGYVVDVIKKPSIKPRKFTLKEIDEIQETGNYCGETADDETRAAIHELMTARAAVKKNKPALDIVEPFHLFGARLLRDIEQTPEKYFQRVEIFLSPNELEEFAADIWQVHKSKQAGFFPRNPSACQQRGECEFLPVCGQCLDPLQPIDGYYYHNN
jgi:hypothetical protein